MSYNLGLLKISHIAYFKLEESDGLTVYPEYLSIDTKGTPELRSVLITGNPFAIASSCTIPKASASLIEGKTNKSDLG